MFSPPLFSSIPLQGGDSLSVVSRRCLLLRKGEHSKARHGVDGGILPILDSCFFPFLLFTSFFINYNFHFHSNENSFDNCVLPLLLSIFFKFLFLTLSHSLNRFIFLCTSIFCLYKLTQMLIFSNIRIFNLI